MRLARVAYWNNVPAPYAVERFNALARRGNLKFEAWFSKRQGPGRSWEVHEEEWGFEARYIADRPVLGRPLHLPIAELRHLQPDLLVSLYASASFTLGSLVARAAGARIAFRVLPTYDAWVQRSESKEFLKHFLFRSADGVKVPGRDGANMARRYGIPDDRIYSVTQSVDVAHYRQAFEVTPGVRAKRREKLGLQGCVFLYVGRLWSGKGLDHLFDAYRQMRLVQPNSSLLLVGDGVDEARYRALARNLPNVTFAGFVQPRELPSYYAVADVLVLPTLGDPHGLVVEEAMAASLPVICTTAAGDIRRRLPDGRAGYVIPPANAAQLADRMLQLAEDATLRKAFGAEGQGLVGERVHEQWASDFEGFVERVLSMPPRRTPQVTLARAAGLSLLAGFEGSLKPSRGRATSRRPRSPSG